MSLHLKFICVFIVVWIMGIAVAFAQPGFNLHVDPEGASRGFKNILNHNDTLYFSSTQRDPETGIQEIYFASVDSNGQLLFLETVRDTGDSHLAMDFTTSIIRNRNGNFLTMATPLSRPSNLLFKFDPSGELLWRQEYFPPPQVWPTFVRRLVELEDGYMIGATYGYADSRSHMVVIRTDWEGNELWRKAYGGPEVRQSLLEMIVLQNGNVFFSGNNTSLIRNPFEETWGQSQLYIIDTAGNVVDSWQSGIEEETTVGKVNEVNDGFIYATSIRELITEFNAVAFYPRLVRRKWDFTEVWRVEVTNVPSGNVIYEIHPLADGNFVAVGIVVLPMEEDYTCVFKFTPDGEILWTTCTRVPGYGHESNSYDLVGVTELSSGSIVASGTHNRPGNPGKNIAWLVKMDADGCITDSLCIPVNTAEFSLSPASISVFPNPATDHVVFEIDNPSGVEPVSVTIFDAMGGNVHHHRWKEGADGYRWDASSFASGIYFYRFQFNEGSEISGKIVLLR